MKVWGLKTQWPGGFRTLKACLGGLFFWVGPLFVAIKFMNENLCVQKKGVQNFYNIGEKISWMP
jgi:hypothetical protein